MTGNRLDPQRSFFRTLRLGHSPVIAGMWLCCAAAGFAGCISAALLAAEAQEETAAGTQEKDARKTPAVQQALASPHGLVRLSKEHEIWIDPKRKIVVVDGEVVLREGLLEMFACPKGTKEHESVVAVNSNAQLIHTGLLAIGAVPGRPVQFQPEYAPATGTEVEIWVLWTNAAGERQKVRAQEWIKELNSGKVMPHPWVFAGSGFWTDETTGQRYYYGDAGDLICVSNFPSATLDLPIKSSQANESLGFTAFTENIPPRGTKVRLVLMPKQVDRHVKKPSEPTKPPAS